MSISTTTHLTTTVAFKDRTHSDQSQLIIDAFTKCCLELDASIFEPFMEEEDVFEDKSKYLFLAELKSLFDSYKNHNPIEIVINYEDGTCTGCNFGKVARMFSIRGCGRILFKYQFAYIIEKKEGILIDIFRCSLFNNKARQCVA